MYVWQSVSDCDISRTQLQKYFMPTSGPSFLGCVLANYGIKF